jgi:hypothetical protein
MDSRVYGNVVFSCEGMTFDAECTVGPPGLCGLTVDDLLRRATWNRELFSFPFREVEGHDHALLLMVNVYKDHVVHASTRAIEDLLRVSQQKDFRPPVLASRCVAAGNGTLGFVLASYLGERFVSPPWQAVAQALAPGPRPLYARAMARLLESPRPLWQEDLLRYACRGASDHRAQQIRSLLVMALWALEQRLVQKRF